MKLPRSFIKNQMVGKFIAKAIPWKAIAALKLGKEWLVPYQMEVDLVTKVLQVKIQGIDQYVATEEC